LPSRRLDEYLPRDRRFSDCSEVAESVAKLTAEKTVALLTKGLLDKLEAILEKLSGIESELRDLKRTVKSLESQRGGRAPIILHNLRKPW